MTKVAVSTGNNTGLPTGTELEIFSFADGGIGQYGAIVDPANPTRAIKPDAAGAVPVTGPATDAQMRATAIPISNASDARRVVITTVTRAADTAGYTAGDAIGALFTLAAASRAGSMAVVLRKLQITTNNSAYIPSLRIQWFSANDAGTASNVADNAPFVYLTADENGVWQGFVDLGPMSTSVGAPTLAQAFDTFEHGVVTDAGGNLYGQITTTTAISASTVSQIFTITATFSER